MTAQMHRTVSPTAKASLPQPWTLGGLACILLGIIGGYELPTMRQGDTRGVAHFERTQFGVVKETPMTRWVRFRVSDELHIEGLTGYCDLRH